jgi:hypothetical protein
MKQLMVALFTGATVAQNGASPREMARKPVRVLLVVAHPDDEYEVAGTVYRISKELFGAVVSAKRKRDGLAESWALVGCRIPSVGLRTQYDGTLACWKQFSG